MKHIKLFESIFLDNTKEVRTIINKFDSEKSKLHSGIKKMQARLEEIDAEIKADLSKIQIEYLEEIKSYMVDVEDFKCYYNEFNADKPCATGRYCCQYQFVIKFEDLERFEDLIFKLNSILTKDAFVVSYDTLKGSVSLENIKKQKIPAFNIRFRFRKIPK